MAYDVFISYSSRDKSTADAVCEVLESECIRCWIAPRDVEHGRDWGESIIEGINVSRVMVLVLSSAANTSPQIIREVERAVSKGIPVIPLRIEDVRPTASLEYFLSTPHWLDAFTPPLDRHLRYLAQVVQRILTGTQRKTEFIHKAASSPPPPISKEMVEQVLSEPSLPSERASLIEGHDSQPNAPGGLLSTLSGFVSLMSRVILLGIFATLIWVGASYWFDYRRQQNNKEEAQKNAASIAQSTATSQSNPANNPPPPVTEDDLKNDLVLHFSFDRPEPDGHVPDLSGNGNDGLAVGVRWTENGQRGGAFVFNGFKNYITVTNDKSLNPEQITLSAWIKTTFKDWVWRRIFDKGSGEGFVLSMCGDDKGKSFRGEVGLEAGIAPGVAWAHTVTPVTDGQWHQVVGTFDGIEAKMYVDGLLVGIRGYSKGNLARTPYNLTIGANRSNPDPKLGEVDTSFNGTMDDLMMFNRALSGAEVKALFDSQRNVPITPGYKSTTAASTAIPAIKYPNTPIASEENWVRLISTAPTTPATLKDGQIMNVKIQYLAKNTSSVSITVHPMAKGSPTPWRPGRTVYSTGEAQVFFSCTGGKWPTDVDQLEVTMQEMTTNDSGRTLGKTLALKYFPVDFHWR